MARHRSSASPDGVSTNARPVRTAPGVSVFPEEATEITDIIPFNEFGNLADLEFRENSAFDRESQVIHAPELDDLHDTDDLTPMRLAVPSRFRPDAREERPLAHAYRDSHTDVSDGMAATDIIDIGSRRGL
ncbi:MAG TPA: M23 family peptidase, partial [Mycobacterium sp.]|nr:M23 family peptidase [Mycobacterium sp.]